MNPTANIIQRYSTVTLMAAIFLFLLPAFSISADEKQVQTPVEKSKYSITSRYTQIVEYLNMLDSESPLLRMDSFGKTAEGRDLLLAVLGTPPPTNPESIDRQTTTVLFINANIHAGEVCGKEACLMLIRDILKGGLSHLLENTIILIAPDYNADGNERIGPNNRRRQPGPEEGVGVRTNAQQLDLNRDMMKLDSPEANALVTNIMVRWDPDIVVDCHTTNGSYHQEPITYAHSFTPLNDPELTRFNRDLMLPWIAKRTKDRKGESYDSIPYGNFRNRAKPEEGWSTFDHKPRYVSNYAGLRNSLSVLIEMYMYADYDLRIKACRAFLQSIAEFAQEEGEAVRKVNRNADASAIKAGSTGNTPLLYHMKFELEPLEKKVSIKGYEMEIKENSSGRKRATPNLDKPKIYTVSYYGNFQPKDEGFPLPHAYLFPRGLIDINSKLISHGIEIEEINEPFTAEVECFNIDKIDFSPQLYQGYRLQSLTGKWEKMDMTFPGGAFIVRTNQAQARLAAYLLEPQSDDGLACWNKLNKYLNRGVWDTRPGIYPVAKLLKKKKLK